MHVLNVNWNVLIYVRQHAILVIHPLAIIRGGMGAAGLKAGRGGAGLLKCGVGFVWSDLDPLSVDGA